MCLEDTGSSYVSIYEQDDLPLLGINPAYNYYLPPELIVTANGNMFCQKLILEQQILAFVIRLVLPRSKNVSSCQDTLARGQDSLAPSYTRHCLSVLPRTTPVDCTQLLKRTGSCANSPLFENTICLIFSKNQYPGKP